MCARLLSWRPSFLFRFRTSCRSRSTPGMSMKFVNGPVVCTVGLRLCPPRASPRLLGISLGPAYSSSAGTGPWRSRTVGRVSRTSHVVLRPLFTTRRPRRLSSPWRLTQPSILFSTLFPSLLHCELFMRMLSSLIDFLYFLKRRRTSTI